MRVVFMGTPSFAVPTLEALIASPHEVAAAVCQPDRPAGRGQRLAVPPVKVVAEAHGVPVQQPETLRTAAAVADIAATGPEVVVVAAYGKILPRALLDLPPRGCVNVHASLLPRYRGAAPIQWAILHGERETGITIMQINERMDAGDILLQRATAIGEHETYGELQDRLALLGAPLLLEALEALERGTLRGVPQDEAQATLAPRLDKAAGAIDWSQPAVAIERRVRAFNPWPSAYTRLGGQQLKIHRASVMPDGRGEPGSVIAVDGAPVVACGADALRLDEVQVEGRQRLSGEVFARGARLQVGAVLG
jgi:methionyl-tRNA formyltransferase